VCVHAHPPSTSKTKERRDNEVVSSFFGLSSYIFFTSKPIHELRLDLNVANTVIALTIRVI